MGSSEFKLFAFIALVLVGFFVFVYPVIEFDNSSADEHYFEDSSPPVAAFSAEGTPGS